MNLRSCRTRMMSMSFLSRTNSVFGIFHLQESA